MAKLALYQKYRSSTFDEVVGQEYVVQSIKNAVRENKVGHAYLSVVQEEQERQRWHVFLPRQSIVNIRK